jgi:hypothetical protein
LSQGTCAKYGWLRSASAANIPFGVVPPETAIRATPRASTAAVAADANSSAAPAASSAGVGQILYVIETGRGICHCLFVVIPEAGVPGELARWGERESAFAFAFAIPSQLTTNN